MRPPTGYRDCWNRPDMAQLCPSPGPDDPLVRSLLGVVDCNVEGLVRGGYAALFEPSSAFAGVLTTLLTLFVAVLGYRLLLGRDSLRVGDLAVTAVKIGVVLALTTGWATYQTVVYDFLFRGPAELAGVMLAEVQPEGSLFRGDVFDGLQAVFDALNAFAKAFGGGLNGQAAVGAAAGGGSFGAQALIASAMILLLSSLGVLLATKIVLGLLLAIGPIFIALLLFESTRGLFEGWLRAAIAFAFAPLASTVILGVALTVLEPSLLRLRDQVAAGDFSLNAVYAVLILVLVFAAVSLGALVAGGVVALGLRLPAPRVAATAGEAGAPAPAAEALPATPSRAARLAATAAAMDRREAGRQGSGATAAEDRRTSITLAERGGRSDRAAAAGFSSPVRLGQSPRRGASPKARRSETGSIR